MIHLTPSGPSGPVLAFSGVALAFERDIQARKQAMPQDSSCLRPVAVNYGYGNPEDSGIARYVRCRKCLECLRVRALQWKYRAEAEFLAHERSWWLTLTYRYAAQASYEDVKRFFKRLRKASFQFRYVVSEELGDKHGRRHFHVLLHCDNSLKARDIKRQWGSRHGYVGGLRLARSAGLAIYMAKYLAKQSRMRASTAYGGEETIFRLCPREWASQSLETLVRQGVVPMDWLSIKFGLRPPRRMLQQLRDLRQRAANWSRSLALSLVVDPAAVVQPCGTGGNALDPPF